MSAAALVPSPAAGHGSSSDDEKYPLTRPLPGAGPSVPPMPRRIRELSLLS